MQQVLLLLHLVAGFALIASGADQDQNNEQNEVKRNAELSTSGFPFGLIYKLAPGDRQGKKAVPEPPKKVYKIELRGDPTLPYVGQLEIGQPKQKFNVLFDTGTSNIWLPSPDCKVNEKPWDSGEHSKFNVHLSKTFNSRDPKPRCRRHPDLGLKLHASMLEDTVHLADQSGDTTRVMSMESQQISLIYKVTSKLGPFNLPYDGWAGLCLPGAEGDDYRVDLLANIALHETVAAPIFTFYTTLKTSPNPETGELERITEMVIGDKELDKLRYVPPIAWTFVTRAPFWEIRVHSMKLMEQQQQHQGPNAAALATVCEHGCEAIIRTGFKFIAGPKADIEALNRQLGFTQHGDFDRETFVVPTTCAEHIESRASKASLMFHIGQVQNLEMKLDMLMFEDVDRNGSTVCVSALRAGESSKWTLGAPFTMNFYTIFHYGKKHVGIAKASRPRSLRD